MTDPDSNLENESTAETEEVDQYLIEINSVIYNQLNVATQTINSLGLIDEKISVGEFSIRALSYGLWITQMMESGYNFYVEKDGKTEEVKFFSV